MGEGDVDANDVTAGQGSSEVQRLECVFPAVKGGCSEEESARSRPTWAKKPRFGDSWHEP